MKKYSNSIEITPIREEHTDNIKFLMKDFYLDEPVFKAQKIDIEKLNKSFYEYKKNYFSIVAIDTANNNIVSIAINSIIKPDNAMKQIENAGKQISTTFCIAYHIKEIFNNRRILFFRIIL